MNTDTPQPPASRPGALERLRRGCSPWRRGRQIRDDDSAQVMVLTGVMMFVLMMFLHTTMNSSSLIYNRIRTQNAVDAAADAHALWQARGMNLIQHINDFHMDILEIGYWIELPTCAARMACPFLLAVPFAGFGLYKTCCSVTGAIIKLVENAQAIVSPLVRTLQKVLNIAMPVMGYFAANSIAKANGAAPLIGSIVDQIEDLLGMFGVHIDISKTVMAIPMTDAIYVFPITVKNAFTLNIKPKKPAPNTMPWKLDSTIVSACDLVCRPVSSTICVKEKFGEYKTPKCGWKTGFMFGYPSYNTWIAGKDHRNLLPAMADSPWLNPRMNARDPLRRERRIDYKGADDLAFESRAFSRISRYRNPAFVVMASSQPWGNDDKAKQPVVESSNVSGFRYAKPQLISVHMGDPPTDDFAEKQAIWH